MKAPRSALLAVVLLLAGSTTALLGADKAPSSPAAPLTFDQRVKEVQDKIAALFQHRNQTPPPLNPRNNPFRTPGSLPVAVAPAAGGEAGGKVPAGAEAPAPGPGASLAVLQQGVATLKITGTLRKGDSVHLVINKRSYKEGDLVQTQVQGETVYVRVKEIADRVVTLSLNDAEMTLKFGAPEANANPSAGSAAGPSAAAAPGLPPIPPRPK